MWWFLFVDEFAALLTMLKLFVHLFLHLFGEASVLVFSLSKTRLFVFL